MNNKTLHRLRQIIRWKVCAASNDADARDDDDDPNE